MPLDNRRIQAPENTTPYSHFFVDLDEIKKLNRDELHKTLFMKTGVVSQAKGSAYIEQNATKVICSVFDPREIPHKLEYSTFGELYCEFKFAPFSTIKRRGHQQDAEERDLSLSLKRALEPVVCRHEFPNFQVDIYALVLEDHGSSLAAAITCSGLALADAGVPLYDLIAASSMIVKNDLKFLDPTSQDESRSKNRKHEDDGSNQGIITLAYMPAHEQVSHLKQTGSMDFECLEGCINSLVESCKEIYFLVQKCLVENIKKRSLENKIKN